MTSLSHDDAYAMPCAFLLPPTPFDTIRAPLSFDAFGVGGGLENLVHLLCPFHSFFPEFRFPVLSYVISTTVLPGTVRMAIRMEPWVSAIARLAKKAPDWWEVERDAC